VAVGLRRLHAEIVHKLDDTIATEISSHHRRVRRLLSVVAGPCLAEHRERPCLQILSRDCVAERGDSNPR
jgi:hypothetical protein